MKMVLTSNYLCLGSVVDGQTKLNLSTHVFIYFSIVHFAKIFQCKKKQICKTFKTHINSEELSSVSSNNRTDQKGTGRRNKNTR